MEFIDLKDIRIVPDGYYSYSQSLKDSGAPIVIDNGSYQCRIGWSFSEKPQMIFRNLIAKPRKDRIKNIADATGDPPIQIGNDITNIEAVRFQLKTQFDRNVVTHLYNQEQVFDHIFTHLNIDNNGSVSHPIVLTECPANPNYCRNAMNELLFELYDIPSVCYGIDALFSFENNKIGKNGLIINFGYHTTHIIPILNGKMIMEKCRRLNIGGYHMITFLYRLLQLKYPIHVNAVTVSRAEQLFHSYGRIVEDYIGDLNKWAFLDYYEKNVKILQLPYCQQTVTTNVVTAEQKLERRNEQSKRIIEINNRKREEKIEEEEKKLNQLLNIRRLRNKGFENKFAIALKEVDLIDAEELEKTIANTSTLIEKMKNRMSVPIKKVDSKVQVPKKPLGISIEEWIDDIKSKRTIIVERKQARVKRRQELAKRRTAASQERMRIISQLARKEKGVDDFGMRDEDWDVYKTISRENSDSENENEKLVEYEEILKYWDPKHFDPATPLPSVAEYHQLHVGVELIRIPELLFQPSIIGNSEAGLSELIEFIFKLFTSEEQLLLANNVFLSGGCSQIPGLKERISKELQEMRPFQSTFKIHMADSPQLDAWLGARDFAQSDDLSNYLLNKEEYLEKGGEYLKEHPFSNYYFPTPVVPPEQTEI